jgi:hypothetical protein
MMDSSVDAACPPMARLPLHPFVARGKCGTRDHDGGSGRRYLVEGVVFMNILPLS